VIIDEEEIARMRRAWLIAAMVIAGGLLIAGGAMGGAWMCVNSIDQARNSTGYEVLNSASNSISPTNATHNMMINAQPATGTTINTPTSPFNGELFSVCNSTGSAWANNVVTLAPASGQSLNAGTTTALGTLGAHTCEELQYQLSNSTWYQVR
jgi:hypothetical protein